jgi:hypothetical protein
MMRAALHAAKEVAEKTGDLSYPAVSELGGYETRHFYVPGI